MNTLPRKKLPIGIQTFAKIRENDACYYVDKTPYALKLIEQGSHYFLSRPRRFGKSLFLDTLKELFSANKTLFTGLYAEDNWDWSIKYPVIRISFGGGDLNSREALDERIREMLVDNQAALGVSCTHQSIPGIFGEIIQNAAKKYGQRTVVLVDEYDKPILDNITEPEIALAMREGLRNFYSVIKDSDQFIKFAMLTGVSKFSKVSLFSGLNNLNDISIDAKYSAICGYTENDVDTIFAPELAGLNRDEIRRWYNGYNWTGESVYNPFDLLLLFEKRIFRPYWFETGTPTFLIKLLTERKKFIPNLEQMMAPETLLSTFDVDTIPTEALMFQAGYLTIDRTEHIFGEYRYHLRYPNHEVYQSLSNSLLVAWCGTANNIQETLANKHKLGDLLIANDLAAMKDLFHAFFASIPNDWYRNNPITQYEGYWASIFYSYFAALGLDIILEDVTNHGRIDMTVRFNTHTWLFEFKVVELVPEGKAIEQLRDRNYAEKYKGSGPVHLVGVEFSKDTRNIVGFETETIIGNR